MRKSLLTLLLLLTAVASRAEDFEVDGIYYNITSAEEQTVAVTYKGSRYSMYRDRYTGNVVIPEDVTFDGVTYSVTEIDYRAFINCKGLTSVTIPNSVTAIGNGAFGLCSGLTSVTIPNSVTVIDTQAFFGCSGLTFVSIGNNVATIGKTAFAKCESLKSCYCFADSVPNTYSDAFSDVDMASVVLHVPAASLEEYSSTSPWSNFGQITAIVDTFSVDGIYYRVRFPDELSVAVTYKGDSYYDYKERYSDSVVIPESVTYGDVTYRVAEIGANAFSGCSGLTAVSIPDGVTRISESAFNACSGLESIVVDAGNPVYDSRNNCNAIMETSSNKLVQGCKNTIIPDEVTVIGNGAFSGCNGLTAVTLPDGVTEIGDEAFYNCSGLTFVSIGSWMGTIGASAFGNCESLKGCYCFAENVPSAHSAAFSGVDISSAILHVPAVSLEEYSSTAPWKDFGLITALVDTFSVDGIYYRVTSIEELTVAVTYKGDSYNDYEERYSGSVVIPECVTYGGVTYKVTEIGEFAFYDCSGLTAVTIPDSVTKIGDEAFEGCSLTSIRIPGSVTTIGGWAFFDCSNLESIVVDAGNPVYDSRNNCNAIMETSSNKLVRGCKNTIIPDEVTAIGNGAFSGCIGLTAVTLPEGVTEIGASAFSGCSGLTSIAIPTSVTEIGNGAFYGCSSLIAVTIPDGVTEIGNSTFWDCKKLSFVSIPSSVTAIGDYAFHQCWALLDFYCFAESAPSANLTAFEERWLNYNATLHVPAASLDTYKTTSFWSNFRNVIGMGAIGETFIVDGICYEITSDEELTVAVARKVYMVYSGDVVIPESVNYSGQTYNVTAIANKAFYNCPALTSVSIPNSVTEIGYQAFYDCTALTSVIMPDNVTTIVEQTFYNCSSLASISIPNSTTTIENNAFYGCTSLTSVVIPNSVITIGNNAFAECTGLTTSIFSPKSVPN
ncbi:MAG: leucine-rich repeat domain-containing protein, partial [Bacteroidaceae bacterium]|nr:leucine-rich repeat domain-containing protein [Bacteroidaceae bacterium]